MSGHPSSKHLPPQSSEMGNNLKLYDTDLYQQDKMHFNANAKFSYHFIVVCTMCL